MYPGLNKVNLSLYLFIPYSYGDLCKKKTASQMNDDTVETF